MFLAQLRQKLKSKNNVYIYRNIEALWYNYCCSGKAIRKTYTERVSVALGTQHGKYMCHIVICDLPGSTDVSYIIS
jgi:hypothetical protein